jgi:hypothetical protein
MAFNLTTIPINNDTTVGEAFTIVRDNLDQQIQNVELIGSDLTFTTHDGTDLEVSLTSLAAGDLDATLERGNTTDNDIIMLNAVNELKLAKEVILIKDLIGERKTSIDGRGIKFFNFQDDFISLSSGGYAPIGGCEVLLPTRTGTLALIEDVNALTLDSVTTAGNTTINRIIVGQIFINQQVADEPPFLISMLDTNSRPIIYISDVSNSNSLTLSSELLSSGRVQNFQDKTGTIALLEDIDFTFENGITFENPVVKLGGDITENTTFNAFGAFDVNFFLYANSVFEVGVTNPNTDNVLQLRLGFDTVKLGVETISGFVQTLLDNGTVSLKSASFNNSASAEILVGQTYVTENYSDTLGEFIGSWFKNSSETTMSVKNNTETKEMRIDVSLITDDYKLSNRDENGTAFLELKPLNSNITSDGAIALKNADNSRSIELSDTNGILLKNNKSNQKIRLEGGNGSDIEIYSNDIVFLQNLNANVTLNSSGLLLSSTVKSTVSSNTTKIDTTPTEIVVFSGSAGFNGVKYFADYSADYTNRSLVDKGFIDTQLTSYQTLAQKGVVNGYASLGADGKHVASEIPVRAYGGFTWTGVLFNQSITTANVFEKAGQASVVMGSLNLFTHSTGRLTYTGSVTKQFKIQGSCNITCTSTSQTISIRIAINGTTLIGSENITVVSATGRWEGLTPQIITNLSTNDFIEIYVTNSSNGGAVNQRTMNLIIEQID